MKLGGPSAPAGPQAQSPDQRQAEDMYVILIYHINYLLYGSSMIVRRTHVGLAYEGRSMPSAPVCYFY